MLPARAGVSPCGRRCCTRSQRAPRASGGESSDRPPTRPVSTCSPRERWPRRTVFVGRRCCRKTSGASTKSPSLTASGISRIRCYPAKCTRTPVIPQPEHTVHRRFPGRPTARRMASPRRAITRYPGRLNNVLAASRDEPMRSAMARGSFTVNVSTTRILADPRASQRYTTQDQISRGSGQSRQSGRVA